MDGSHAVDEYIASLEHPHRESLQAVRAIVLDAHPAIAERIKWKSPSFYAPTADGKGIDLGAFELRARDFLRLVLVFPNGLVPDPGGIMLGTWPDRRELRFSSLDDVADTRAALSTIIREWVALLPTRGQPTSGANR